ncbi:MAG: ankyrin repeat domain-containing protein [Acidobacteriota bacterium]
MSLESEFVVAFELHSVRDMQRCLGAGISPTAPIEGKRPVDILIEMYTRSPKFADCLQVLLDAGATVGDPLLEAVLLDNPAALRKALATSPANISRKLTLVSAYTCCEGVTALHVCAEFNSVKCATILIDAGADVNAPADLDADGFGGQTPLFHTVNSNQNYCRPMMELLVNAGAQLGVRLKGLKWGVTMDWETTLFDVTVFSYAQCGLYRQFHRKEEDIYSNLAYLYEKRHGAAALIRNVPNKYLRS